jgi:YVTN family beta-propeller protein
VQVLDAATNRFVAEVEACKRPWNMAITPDGARLYVACGRSDAVAVIDAREFRKVAEIAVGKLPWGVAIR